MPPTPVLRKTWGNLQQFPPLVFLLVKHISKIQSLRVRMTIFVRDSNSLLRFCCRLVHRLNFSQLRMDYITARKKLEASGDAQLRKVGSGYELILLRVSYIGLFHKIIVHPY